MRKGKRLIYKGKNVKFIEFDKWWPGKAWVELLEKARIDKLNYAKGEYLLVSAFWVRRQK